MESSVVPGNVSSTTSVSDSSPLEAQGAGVSPSSTADSTYRVPIVDAPPESSPALSAATISVEKAVEKPPESSDTSYGVEATAVRKLAATTGTVAILGTTAHTPTKENGAVSFTDVHIVGETLKNSQTLPVADETIDIIVAKADEQVVPGDDEKGSNEVDQVKDGIQRSIGSASSDSGRQVPQITETLVASLEGSPVEEMVSRSSPEGVEPISTDLSGIETQITISTDVASDDQIEGCSGLQKVAKPSSDEAKSENNESPSTRTLDNDISSEQMKTNSLSDVSFSDLDEKEAGSAVAEQQPPSESVKTDEPSAESDKSEAELKLVEITPDSLSDSSQQITKEESTSDITTDNQPNIQQGDEERLISTPSDERTTDFEDDDESKRNTAAIKIQSSFRGFKVRKTRSPKHDDDQLEEQLTLSEIEIVKEQVEGIIKEAEETTESLRKTPDIIINHGHQTHTMNTEDDFPAPPDDALLNELQEDDNDKDTQSLNIEPVPYPNGEAVAPVQPIILANTKSDSDEKQSPTENDDTAELARMTADEDLPAPDFELLESSCTEIVTPDKVDDDLQDSTEGDVTLEEDSDKLKELQKPQECDELNPKPAPEVEAEVAATKIQANVRGFLARKQVEQVKQDDGAPSDETGGKNEETKTDDCSSAVEGSQQDETTKEMKPSPAAEDVAGNVAEDLGGLKDETSDADTTQNEVDLCEEQTPLIDLSSDKEIELKTEQSPTPQQHSEEVKAAVAEDVMRAVGQIDEKDSQLPPTLQSETPDLVEPPEGSIAETMFIIDEALDKMSSQSDSISQDTVSQNTVEELLKQHDQILPMKPSIEEDTQDDALAPQDTIDDRMDNEITVDNSIDGDTLIKTLPDVVITPKDAEDERTEVPVIMELLIEPPKALTPDITDRDGNENSSHSIEELSSNQDRESLFPSNDNSSNDLPELSSAEETKGSSTASTTSDSAKEKTSEVSEVSKESESKAATDVDVEEISESEAKKSPEIDEEPKLISEPNIGLEAPKASDIAPTSNESTPVPATGAPDDASSKNDITPSDDAVRSSPGEQSTTYATSAENGKDASGKQDTRDVPEVAATTNGGSAQDMKEIKGDAGTASLKNGSLPNTPSELDEELLNNSATKIQANVRGYLARKKQSPNGSEN
uniref:Uncharacterized protein n=1 Tax=Lygus hesperus TaxID=30085 RepID=A0A0K8TBG8_LYGHE